MFFFFFFFFFTARGQTLSVDICMIPLSSVLKKMKPDYIFGNVKTNI